MNRWAKFICPFGHFQPGSIWLIYNLESHEEHEDLFINLRALRVLRGKKMRLHMRKMLINGKFVESVSVETFQVVNPATEEVIDEVPRARSEDADLALRAAAEAKDDWRFTPGIEKCEMLHSIARDVRSHRAEL